MERHCPHLPRTSHTAQVQPCTQERPKTTPGARITQQINRYTALG